VNRAFVEKFVLNDNPKPSYRRAGEKTQFALLRPVKVDMPPAPYRCGVITVSPAHFA
jgi:hypothetical protein